MTRLVRTVGDPALHYLSPDQNTSKSPCSVGHLSRVAHMPKFKNSTSWKFCPPTHRIYMPSFIDVGPAVLEPWGLENIDIARMHRRTCDQFYKSSQQI